MSFDGEQLSALVTLGVMVASIVGVVFLFARGGGRWLLLSTPDQILLRAKAHITAAPDRRLHGIPARSVFNFVFLWLYGFGLVVVGLVAFDQQPELLVGSALFIVLLVWITTHALTYRMSVGLDNIFVESVLIDTVLYWTDVESVRFTSYRGNSHAILRLLRGGSITCHMGSFSNQAELILALVEAASRADVQLLEFEAWHYNLPLGQTFVFGGPDDARTTI